MLTVCFIARPEGQTDLPTVTQQKIAGVDWRAKQVINLQHSKRTAICSVPEGGPELRVTGVCGSLHP